MWFFYGNHISLYLTHPTDKFAKFYLQDIVASQMHTLRKILQNKLYHISRHVVVPTSKIHNIKFRPSDVINIFKYGYGKKFT